MSVEGSLACDLTDGRLPLPGGSGSRGGSILRACATGVRARSVTLYEALTAEISFSTESLASPNSIVVFASR